MNNWENINKSFFDDIENDILSNDLISDNTSKTLYGITAYTECETAEDFYKFITEYTHIDTIFNHVDSYFNSGNAWGKAAYTNFEKVIPDITILNSALYIPKITGIFVNNIKYIPKNKINPTIVITISQYDMNTKYGLTIRLYSERDTTSITGIVDLKTLKVSIKHYLNAFIKLKNSIK